MNNKTYFFLYFQLKDKKKESNKNIMLFDPEFVK